jgi:ADP-ribosyl-[dinitrogen reductase] hydrolase
MTTEIERYRGCLMGLAVGDALGTTLEFKPKGIVEAGVVPKVEDIIGGGPFNLKPGQWTDDTSMALCLAQSLIDCNGFDAKDQMDKYWRWVEEGYMSSTGKMFDIGNTTSEALERYRKTGHPYAGSKDSKASGNGSLMRLAPIPMAYANEQHMRLRGFAAEMSETTHGSPECVWACRYLAELISRYLFGAEKNDVVSDVTDVICTPTLYSDEITSIMNGGYRSKSAKEIRASGYVTHTLEAALWAFHNSTNFRDGAILAVNLCEDADTTGAVYGQLAGAYYGIEGIPASWIAKITHKEMILDIADKLYGLSKVISK